MDKDTIELILVGVIALGVVVQTIALIALVAAMGKGALAVRKEIDDLRSSIVPVINSTRDVVARVGPKVEAVADEARRLIARVSPKLENAADDLQAITQSLGNQVAEVQAAASDVVGRAQHLAERLDAMASTVLDRVDRAADFVAGTVAKPVRQVSGVLASVKAVVETFRQYDASTRRRPPADTQAAEKDLFV